MNDLFAYRAGPELTKVWREFTVERDRHIETVVEPFTHAYPHHHPLMNSRHNIIGFADGDPDNPPPAGLSRSQRRDHLIPVRGRAGDEWREWMSKLEFPRTKRQVLARFGFGEQIYGRRGKTYLGHPNVVDFGDDGVFVYTGYEITDVPECVTPAKLSEFYAAKERAEVRSD